MHVKVLFFGATADAAGARETELTLSEGTSAAEALESIFGRFPALRAKHAESRLHLSVNQEYADGGEKIRDGDELAVFTAVSGG